MSWKKPYSPLSALPLSIGAKIKSIASVVAEKNTLMYVDQTFWVFLHKQRSTGCEVLMVSALWVYQPLVHTYQSNKLIGFCFEWINGLSSDQNLNLHNHSSIQNWYDPMNV